MKKIDKKQKLIGVISIPIITIILSIVITTNIISNNNQISNEGYLATTANANSNLVASCIQQGITIGGITGTLEVLDTSDATATQEDIAYGKTAYVNGIKITGTRITDNNYEFEDPLGNIVKVPAGFKVVNPQDNVTDGIIIEDVSAGDENTKGSQFVWIPVGEIITETGTENIELGRYTFDTTGAETLVQSAENWSDISEKVEIDTKVKELSSSSYKNKTAKSLEDFIIKTLSSHGYYIGRYEAGDAYAKDSARTSTSSDTNPITCKAGVYPYNEITQAQASSLCQGMYSNSNFESDLINSYVWDTAIVFIQKFSGDTDYSMQVGRNSASAVEKCGESILNYKLDEGDDSLDKRCNIYDMSGNTFEWTTETGLDASSPCILRGGLCVYTQYYTCRRYPYATSSEHAYICSARPIIYL